MAGFGEIAANVGRNVLAAGPFVASYALQQKQFEAVDWWLSNSDTTPGMAAHIGASLGSEALSVLQAPLVSPKNKATNMGNYVASYLNVTPETAQFMNNLNTMFQQPNIEGIAIFTEQEQTERTMDVSTSPLVVQADLSATTYVVDNATPQPRKWTLKGHLTTTLATDHYFVIKPSLMLQRNYLDNCMRTRKPVWFKTFDNNFYLVLITNMTTSWDPKSMNTMNISVQLQEYTPLRVYEGPMSAATAKLLSKFMM